METIVKLVAIVLMSGCSEPMQEGSKMLSNMLHNVPPSGVYASSTGVRYKVNTAGPNALSVTAERGDLCLRFWEAKNPVEGIDAVLLRGQLCSNNTFGDLYWAATFSKRNLKTVILYAPGIVSDRKTRPIEISFVTTSMN